MKKCFKILFQIVKWVFIVIISVIVLFFIVRFIGQRINDRTPEGGINETMYVDINGTKQWINIYGQDKDNPVLLYLHGGPGQPTSYEDYPILRKMSDIYTIVNWDQRACGHSWTKEQMGTQITYEQLFSDGEEMTKFLLDYMDKDKISIMGISWGAAFGARLVLNHPENYDRFFALSLPVDNIEQLKALKNVALEWTKNDPEYRAIAESIIIDQADFDKMTTEEKRQLSMEWNKLYEKYTEPDSEFAGDVNVISAMIFCPYWSVKDYYNMFFASVPTKVEDFPQYPYLDCGQWGNMSTISVLDRTDYKVPVYIIMGDKDYTVMTSVTKKYYDNITAPDKGYYEVEGGHYMPMLLSEKLSETVHEITEKAS